MAKKIRVGLLFGGRSVEHEISLLSAKNIACALDPKKYEIVLIGIDKEGQWHRISDSHRLLKSLNPMLLKIHTSGEKVNFLPVPQKKGTLTSPKTSKPVESIDVIFPILHGPFGEDGTVQGLLKLANIPFVGASVLSSAVCMDKDIMKRILRDAGMPISNFIIIPNFEKDKITFEEIQNKLKTPFFIKPANSGSSVGIHKIETKSQFQKALKDAFQYDRKVLVEEYIQGREIECAVLGNEFPMASVPGEIIPRHAFYSYEAKYLDARGAVLKVPADLPKEIVKKIQTLSIQSYKALCCEGMARVDFFLRGEDELFVNELNTIPGFTKISMYPKMWEASGISYSYLIDQLIQLALDRFKKEKKIKTSYK